MDIEQLKLILQTVSAAGEGAFALAIVFFAKSFIEFLITAALIAIGLFLAYKLLSRFIVDKYFEDELMAAIGTHSYLSASERQRIVELVKKGQSAP